MELKTPSRKRTSTTSDQVSFDHSLIHYDAVKPNFCLQDSDVEPRASTRKVQRKRVDDLNKLQKSTPSEGMMKSPRPKASSKASSTAPKSPTTRAASGKKQKDVPAPAQASSTPQPPPAKASRRRTPAKVPSPISPPAMPSPPIPSPPIPPRAIPPSATLPPAIPPQWSSSELKALTGNTRRMMDDMETVTSGMQTLEDLLRRDDTKKSLKAIDVSVQKALSEIKSSTESALASMDATGERIVSQMQSIISNFTKTIEARISAAVAEIRSDNISRPTSGLPAPQYYPPVPQYQMFYPQQPPPGGYSLMSPVGGQRAQYHPTSGPIDFPVPLAGSGSSTSPVNINPIDTQDRPQAEPNLEKSKGSKKRDLTTTLQEPIVPSKKKKVATLTKEPEPVKPKSAKPELKMSKAELLKMFLAASGDDDEDDTSE